MCVCAHTHLRVCVRARVAHVRACERACLRASECVHVCVGRLWSVLLVHRCLLVVCSCDKGAEFVAISEEHASTVLSVVILRCSRVN